MLSSVKRLSQDMTADLVISTPFGDSFIPVRVLSHHLDSNHGMVAHVIPLSIPITRVTPSPEGESARRGEGRGEGSEEITEIIVPFSTLTNFRPTFPQSEEEGRGEGSEGKSASLSEVQGEGLDITVRERIFTPISIRRIPISPSTLGEGRGEGSGEGKGEEVQS